MRDIPKTRVGLALGSGAARGWAHIGALQALAELGVKPHVICGTSIGALVGGFMLTGQLDELEIWVRRLNKLRIMRYIDVRLAGNGIIAGDRLFAEMGRQLGEILIEDLPLPFACVATDLYTGHEAWLTKGSLAEAIRASFSLPGLFEAVRFDGRWMIDGALVNPVPVSVCHALGAQVVIAVNLNASPLRAKRPSYPGVEREGVMPLPGVAGGLLRAKGFRFGLGRKKESDSESDPPGLVGVLAATLNLVQDRVTRSRLAADPPDVNVVPRVGHIGLLDFHSASECIEAGATAIYQAEADIRAAMVLFEEIAS